MCYLEESQYQKLPKSMQHNELEVLEIFQHGVIGKLPHENNGTSGIPA